jgi:uncharacterized membrane protein HdeD (DUF308 family)
MKTIKENIGSILLSLFEIAVGILLLIEPIGFTSVIIIGIGIALLITGIISTVKYFNLEPVSAAKSKLLLKGLISFLVGYFCIVKYGWVVATFPVLTILYGLGILVLGLAKIQWTADLVRAKRDKWFLAALAALLSMMLAVVILLNPFPTANAVWTFTGIALIIEGAFDIVILIINIVRIKEDEN